MNWPEQLLVEHIAAEGFRGTYLEIAAACDVHVIMASHREMDAHERLGLVKRALDVVERENGTFS